MKSLLIILVLTITMASAGYAQQGVAINADGSPPNAKAMLDVKSTTKGLLIPRMTTTERNNITTPPEGLMVFDTDIKSFYYYKGFWQNVQSSLDLPFNQTISFNGSALTIGNGYPSATALAADLYGGTGIGLQSQGRIGGKFFGTETGIDVQGSIAGKFYSGDTGVVIDMNGNNLPALLVDRGMTGLGTLSPQSKLHVHDANMNNPANLLTVSGYAPNPNETISLVFKYQQPPVNGGPSLPFFGMKSNHPLLFITNDDMDHPSMSIFNNKVGINKTDGTYPFSINGKTGIYENNVYMGQIAGNETSGNLFISAKSEAVNGPSPKNLLLQTSTDFQQKMGYVGINSLSPSAFLEVQKTGYQNTVAIIGDSKFGIGADNNTYIEGGVETGAGALYLNDDNPTRVFIAGGGGDVFIAGGGGDVMITDTASHVCIGTSDKTHKLNVNGTVRSKELIIESNWADYVFRNDYKLKPLEEVDAFIQQYKHLPTVPSALEVQSNGLKVSEASTKMMEKIEELTLYIIEQNNRLKKLEATIEILKTNK